MFHTSHLKIKISTGSVKCERKVITNTLVNLSPTSQLSEVCEKLIDLF